MKSLWRKTTDIPPREPLQRNCKAEVVVIGAGMAGILTAYLLQNSGKDVVVLEADTIGSGQTENTTAKITAQHGLKYAILIESMGKPFAQSYADINGEAIEQFHRIVLQRHIDCAFQRCPAYLFATTAEGENLLQREYEAAKELGISATLTRETQLPFPVASALMFPKQAQFHPLHFLKDLSKDLVVYEHTPVTHVEENQVHTGEYTVTAESIVFATHFPFVNFPGMYFMRMHQERSYVLALEQAQALDGVYLGIDGDQLSLRTAENLLLLGGSGHRTGDNKQGGRYQLLRNHAQKLWPSAKEVGNWSAQDCMPMDGVPYVGQYAGDTPHWFVATGFGKWGMTGSMSAAMLLTDAILKKDNPAASCFSPSRFTPSASAESFATDMGQAVKGLAKPLFFPPKTHTDSLPAGHGGVVEYEGEKMGVYKEMDGKIHVVSIRCPHLGCQLEWNPDEKSWDCPCHGSRFDYTGALRNNPAQQNLEAKTDA